MNKKVITAIIVAVVLLLIIASVIAVVLLNQNQSAEVPTITDTENDSDYPIKVPIILGDTELSEDREELLDKNIIAHIKLMQRGYIKEDENGSYLTDEKGRLIYEYTGAVDYSNVEDNLRVMINTFSDMEYTAESIKQIQRYYFHYCASLAKYDTRDLTQKIALCFPPEGTNSEDLTKNAEKVFGQMRYDGFYFVFEESEAVAELKIEFYNVKAWGNTELSENRAHLCIIDEWYVGDGYDRNLEGWFHKLINEMSDNGYGDKDIITAQLLFAGSLAQSEYRHDLMDGIYQCISSEREKSIDELKEDVQSFFGVNIEDNISLIEYLEGVTVYEGGHR